MDTMSRIFNFSEEREAELFKGELEHEQRRQKDNHIRILEIKKIELQ
jgi:hypothetical protein